METYCSRIILSAAAQILVSGIAGSFTLTGDVGSVVYDFETTWSHAADGGFWSGDASWAPLGTGTFSINETVQVSQVDSVMTSVPEPATVALFMVGLFGIGFTRVYRETSAHSKI